MVTLAYVQDDAQWLEDGWLNVTDLIARKVPSFVFLEPGDLVITMEALGRGSLGPQEWLLQRLFRVTRSQETGDAFDFYVELDRPLSGATGTAQYAIARRDLMREHNWFPDPSDLFKPFPRAVWAWLRDARQFPLP